MCNEYEVLIQKAIDHEISEAEEAKLVAHLDVCDTCKATYEALKQLKACLGQLEEVELPSHFHEDLMAKIHKEAMLEQKEEKPLEKVVPLKKKGGIHHLFKVSGTVAAAVIVGGAFFYQLTSLQQPRMYSASEAAPQEETAMQEAAAEEVAEEAYEAPADNGMSLKMADEALEEDNDSSKQPEMRGLPSERVIDVKVTDLAKMLTEAQVYLNEQAISFTIVEEEIYLFSLEDVNKLKAWFIAEGASLTEEEPHIEGDVFIFRLLT